MKEQSIQMVVFDMAGTVVDEKNVVYKTLQKALDMGGHTFSLETVLTEAGGKEKLQAIKDLIAMSDNLEGAAAQEVYNNFLEQLKIAYDNLDVSTYEGVEALMSRLRQKDIKIVLNTGYNTETASKLLKKMGWQQGKEYDLLVAADKVENSRPAPDMIFYAMEKLGVESGANVAKVGDSMIDIEEGDAAGCQLTFGVTTGAHSKEQLATAKPSYILDSLAELDSYLDVKVA